MWCLFFVALCEQPLVLPPSLKENVLDFGVRSATDASSITFVVVNSNPIEVRSNGILHVHTSFRFLIYVVLERTITICCNISLCANSIHKMCKWIKCSNSLKYSISHSSIKRQKSSYFKERNTFLLFPSSSWRSSPGWSPETVFPWSCWRLRKETQQWLWVTCESCTTRQPLITKQ